MHAYVKSERGRRRWFLHDRGGAPIVDTQRGMSYLQQKFIIVAQNEYGQDKSDLPSDAKKHL